MRLNTSTPTLFAVSSLFCFGSSLPFLSQRVPVLVPLVRRATYSVVPVDGGPAATDAGSPQATIVTTIIHTPAPVTIVETDNVTLPPVTDIVVSTKIIEGPKTTQNIVVTITQTSDPTTATTTATEYSIIDVSSPPVTVVIPVPASSSALSTTSTSVTVSSESSSTSVAALSSSSKLSCSKSSPTTSTSTSTSSLAISPSTPITSANSSSSAITSSASSAQTTSVETYSTSISSVVVSTSTPTYDDGQWHTYYPTWSNATGTPTGLASRPTLKASLDSAGE
ncbi:hypothetical protein ONS95_008466 [Cadophora gregata]|uniref:uncharacterized protein n=1 Tax=Cadophora gregata TaxID=51156 RepID=UPI0026DC90E8|nr:uncharacterized protein ONS95_008466 [Cadophora gregata]KAK0100126.1 hypothetical protein ONS95_008466 [Cadophora gregata]KAK0114934.1 hypothetical protein ONS96_013408 [Cadophora gregata f. sp. sojae]